MKKILFCFALAMTVGCGSSSDSASDGELCGGATRVECRERSFCRFQDASCGSQEQVGVCEEKPDVCVLVYEPVCGCNGKSYDNRCFAGLEGISVEREGPCPGDESQANSTQ